MKPILAALGLLACAANARAGCEAAGGWDLRVEWPARTVAVELIVEAGEGGPTVFWRGPQGELEGREVHCEGPTLSFTLEVQDRQEETVRLSYEGRADGKALTGRLKTPRGLEITANGKRSDQKADPE